MTDFSEREVRDFIEQMDASASWLTPREREYVNQLADMLAEREETLSAPMNLRVALDFADNPRPYHSLACPADTNGELYRALKVLAAAYRGAHPAAQPRVPDVDAMVQRFLNWRLPKPWNPDNGISYERPNYMHEPCDADWPTGTNLFDADQARAMIEHMLAAQESPNG